MRGQCVFSEVFLRWRTFRTASWDWLHAACQRSCSGGVVAAYLRKPNLTSPGVSPQRTENQLPRIRLFCGNSVWWAAPGASSVSPNTFNAPTLPTVTCDAPRNGPRALMRAETLSSLLSPCHENFAISSLSACGLGHAHMVWATPISWAEKSGEIEGGPALFYEQIKLSHNLWDWRDETMRGGGCLPYRRFSRIACSSLVLSCSVCVVALSLDLSYTVCNALPPSLFANPLRNAPPKGIDYALKRRSSWRARVTSDPAASLPSPQTLRAHFPESL